MQYNEGYLIDGRYCLKSFVGSGSFGEVWVASDTQTDLEVAIKIYISMDAQGLSDFKKEFQLSFNFNHTNLLHANYLGVNPSDNRPYLVMPYCPDGSSTKLCGVIDEPKLWVFIRDVAAGLSYLHNQQPPVIHQDIKPDNILVLKSGEFVITDFGISKQLRSSLRKSAANLNSAGAVSYMGPERFSKQYQAVKASDVWSLGVAIYELATGDLPFCGMGGSMQKRGAEIPELPADFSEEINGVMTACLAPETWDRPTAAQVAEYADRFIKGERNIPSWLKLEKQEPEKPADAAKPSSDTSPEPDGTKPDVNKTVALSVADSAKTVVSTDPSKPERDPKPFPKWLIGIIAAVVIAIAAILLWPKPVEPDSMSAFADSTAVAVPAEVDPMPASADSTTVAVEEAVPEEPARTVQVEEPVMTEKIEVESIALDKSDLVLDEGGTATIAVRYTPKNATGKTTVWSSTDTKVAKVNNSGRVTAVAAGSAAIIAVCNGKDASCSVTVKAKNVQQVPQQQTYRSTVAPDSPITGTRNGHEWVDLGLSVKWATTNIGATSPGGYGEYFAWGETRSKKEYYLSDMQYFDAITDGKDTLFFKYNSTDNKSVLDPSDDAASVNWGGGWRMPTNREFNELIKRCNWTWTSVNGVKGYVVKSRANQNSIFLPAAGYRNAKNLSSAGSEGSYWSSSLGSVAVYCAFSLNIADGDRYSMAKDVRSLGFSIRPVCK